MSMLRSMTLASHVQHQACAGRRDLTMNRITKTLSQGPPCRVERATVLDA